MPGLEHSVKVHTDAQGRKWLGDVPYDVFFNDPLAVAAEGGTPAVARQAALRRLGGSDKPSAEGGRSFSRAGSKPASRPASRKPEAAAGRDWNALIEMDVLDAEVKRIRNELAAQLQSVPKYNSHFQEIAIAGTTLAAVAEIVAEHPGSVSWKPNAPFVRDLAAKIHDAASAPGGPAFQATKTPYEQLVDVLDGNLPAGVPVPSRSGISRKWPPARPS